MVEGARLESVYTGNRIAGSNPAPSANYSYTIIFNGRFCLDHVAILAQGVFQIGPRSYPDIRRFTG